MHISIIVPCYNGAVYIESFFDAISALEVSTSVEVEFVIVDNGSSDNSLALLHRLSKGVDKFDFRIFEFKAKQGSYATRNFAVGQSNGTILAFTDIDCILPPDYLVRLCEKIENQKSQYIIAGNVELFLSPSPNVYEYYDFVFGFNIKSYVKEETGVTANAVLSHSTFIGSNGFDEVESGGDRAFFKKVIKQGVAFQYYPDFVVFHPCRNSYAALLGKAKRVSRGHAGYYKKLGMIPRFKRIIFLILSSIFQPHQFKVIANKKNIIGTLPFGQRVYLIGLIFWIGFYSRMYTIHKTISN